MRRTADSRLFTLLRSVGWHECILGNANGRLVVDDVTRANADAEEFSREEVAESRKKTRLNALILLLIFILSVVVPYPWNVYVPLLIVVPMVYALVARLKKVSPSRMDSDKANPGLNGSSTVEPYARAPKDPHDPRKYRPIG
jgi:hypothetical protein